MPYTVLDSSPLAQGARVRIFYREFGSGDPLVILHGGWGYGAYPFDRQIEHFSKRSRVFIPDRTGYGRSDRLRALPPDFHDLAALETVALIEHLQLERPVLWGHSDGAVIAAKMAIGRPDRLRAILLEAIHYRRQKPASRAFFEAMAVDPARLGERVCRVMAEEHGGDYWQTLLAMNGRAWLAIADESKVAPDLYGGLLTQVRLPTAVIHGRRDPRTEPGELEEVRAALPHAMFAVHEEAGHSPHSDRRSSEWTTQRAIAFLDTVASGASAADGYSAVIRDSTRKP